MMEKSALKRGNIKRDANQNVGMHVRPVEFNMNGGALTYLLRVVGHASNGPRVALDLADATLAHLQYTSTIVEHYYYWGPRIVSNY